MNTLYRKVLCSERLPDDVNYHDTDDGPCYYYNGRWYDEYGPLTFTPEWWLEEVVTLGGSNEDVVYWIIITFLRGMSPEKQKEITKSLLSRGMIDLPTNEEIEKMADEFSNEIKTGQFEYFESGVQEGREEGFIKGFKSCLEILTGGIICVTNQNQKK